jgi:hypothetical protein
MTTSSEFATERARKMHSTFLRRLHEPGRATAVAAVMGVAESTVSRVKTKQAETFFEVLAHLGFKIVDEDSCVVNRQTLGALLHLTKAAIPDAEAIERLVISQE